MIKLFVLLVTLCCFAATAQSDSAVVKTGVDNLIDVQFDVLAGKNVVLVSHAAARSLSGRTTLQEMLRAGTVRILRVLAPEHGYDGITKAGVAVSNGVSDTIPVMSLYGKDRKPTLKHLQGADVVVIDLQDIGTRSYTYVSTMIEVLQSCAENGIPVIILDRPNPLGGEDVDGAIPEGNYQSFVCRIPVPYIHGLTLGEIAGMANKLGWLGKLSNGFPKTCSLTVVRCKGWSRSDSWRKTMLAWYPTSPNIPTSESATYYPFLGLLGELGWCSIGIGTTMPFAVFGAPWMVRDTIIEHRMKRYGILLRYGRFVPQTGMYKDQVCYGYHIARAPGAAYRPFTAAMMLISRLRNSYPDHTASMPSPQSLFVRACGSEKFLDVLKRQMSVTDIESLSESGVADFIILRTAFLLY